MGLFTKKSSPDTPSPSVGTLPTAPTDSRYPGLAGYVGTTGLKKNAMPELRFKFVRPDGKPDS